MHLIARIASVVFILLGAQATAATPPVFEGHRGVAVVQTFMFPIKAHDNTNRYEVDPYIPHWSVVMLPSRMAELRTAGFDFLRIAIDPGPLMDSDGEVFDERIAEIADAIDQTLKAGLKVLIDIHVNETHPLWGARVVTAGSSTPAQERYFVVLRALALLSAKYDPSSVALEVFNEPPPPCDWNGRVKWPQQLSAIYKVARAIAPNTTLFVAGTCFAAMGGLEYLNANTFDANTVFVFHYYNPDLFTYQGFWDGAGYLPYVTRLPYPPDPALLNSFLARTINRIATAKEISAVDRTQLGLQATKALRHYFLETHGRSDIDQDFDKAQAWAKRNDVPDDRIILGEFGSMRDVWGREGADPQSRARWLSDARSVAEAHGFRWAVWSLTNTDGIVTGDTAGPLDQTVLQALGLNVTGHD